MSEQAIERLTDYVAGAAGVLVVLILVLVVIDLVREDRKG